MTISTLRTRIAGIVAALALGTGLTAVGAPPADAASSWVFIQTDADWCYDSATLDLEGNGNANDVWFDLDNDCQFDTRVWNTTGSDDFLEQMTYNGDENAWVDYMFLDTDQRVGFDFYYTDLNQDGSWDGPSAPPAYTLLADIALSEIRVNGVFVACGRPSCN
jgi:hypothetical protein